MRKREYDEKLWDKLFHSEEEALKFEEIYVKEGYNIAMSWYGRRKFHCLNLDEAMEASSIREAYCASPDGEVSLRAYMENGRLAMEMLRQDLYGTWQKKVPYVSHDKAEEYRNEREPFRAPGQVLRTRFFLDENKDRKPYIDVERMISACVWYPVQPFTR